MPDKTTQYRTALTALLSGAEYEPMRSRDMAYILGIPRKEFHDFRQVLEQLREQGFVRRGRNARWYVEGQDTLVTGRIDIAMAGHAFVIPDNPDEKDIFIAPGSLGFAFDGDTVQVRITSPSRGADRARGGEVVDVVNRAKTRFVACMQPNSRAQTLDPRSKFEFDVVLADTLPAKSAAAAAKSIRRRRNAATAKQAGASTVPAASLPQAGTKVLIHVLSWPGSPDGSKAEIIEVLGPAGDPDTETAAILGEFDAPGPFPPEVLRQANHFAPGLDSAEMARRLDCTNDICCTIDPETARDFDDALGIRDNGDGTYTVDVHIADVAHYVLPGSALDEEARDRSTSIYLPERVIPMLPEELCNDLCSLRPHEIRPAKTVRMMFSADGERLWYSIHRSAIRSRRRFTYAEVKELIDYPGVRKEFDDQPLAKCIMDLYTLAMTLRQKRMTAGSIELNIEEYSVIIDAEGKAQGLQKNESDYSHQLVEEYMLAANQAVAEWAAQNGLPALHRQHAVPSPQSMKELAQYLNASGYTFKPPYQRRKLITVIEKARGCPEEHALNIMILRSFQRACYGPEADIGHYALNFPKYMHFTSPIRRYPDLQLHQALDRAFESGPADANCLPRRLPAPITASEDLQTLGSHCSQRERRAMQIEEEVKNFRRLELLSRADNEELPAIVTSVKKFGIFVEVENWFVEGMIPRPMLAAKGFACREDLPPRLVGRKKNKSLQPVGQPGFYIGQRVLVRIRRVDLSARLCELDFIGLE